RDPLVTGVQTCALPISSVSLKTLPHEVKTGHPILLADGNIELRVERIVPPDIYCRVIVGGVLSSHKGINLPGSEVHVDSLTKKEIGRASCRERGRRGGA